MTSNLSHVNLGSVATFRAGYAFPKKDQGKSNGEIPFIKVSDFNIPGNEYHIIRANNYVDADYVKKRKLKIFPAGTIVFAKIGIALLSDRIRVLTRPTLIDNNLMGCVAKGVNEKYLSYILELIHLSRHAEGSALPFLKQSTIEQLPINIHSHEIQDKIACFISNLELKIECNNKIIEVLENFSISLVNHAIGTSRIENSVHLSEYALLNPNRKLSKDHVARYIGMSSLTSTSTPQNWEFKSYKGGVKFKNGDTLVARITPCLENNKGAFINILEEGEIAFGSTEYITISSKGDLPNEFFYCLSKTKEFRDYAIKHLNGTSGRQRVSADDLAAFCLPSFSSKEKSLMQNSLPSFFAVIANLSRQNKLLTTMRDRFLPKLLSGEIELTN